MNDAETLIYPSLMATLKYVQDQGYAVKKSKLYKDRKDGLIRMEPDGRPAGQGERDPLLCRQGGAQKEYRARSRFRQIVDVNMVKWCQVLHGDQAKVNDAVDLAGADIDDMMNALARSDTFQIEYTQTEKGV